eukprot:CAMPEP_0202849768 /NCGR_PEP_ID=MMETSP1389-20130828/81703_1 /ASSEMBLY_ACC=CAM_ASM_000865 /TAXON_ID=302021 /ORGANISM="Rhodomonas sp., Strain CCMP768" /LENGTH=167 /DNA_ID=CAMNT_0049527851 /DNA_START=15 /DNA_END=518 /DNA_ORIENTATION=-
MMSPGVAFLHRNRGSSCKNRRTLLPVGGLSMESLKYELEGTLKVVNDVMKFDSGFTKREFVVTTEEMYPQDVKFEVVKDRCALLDQYNPGDHLKVSFNIRGNEWQNKYYVNLQAWRIEKLESQGLAKQVDDSVDLAQYEGFKQSDSGGKKAKKAKNFGWDDDMPLES